MGWLDAFSKKEQKNIASINLMRNQIAASFSGIKRELDNQNKWISYLNKSNQDLSQSHRNLSQSHKEINQLHHSLKTSHETHKGKVNTHIDHISKWIDYLHTSNKAQEQRLKNLEESINKAFTLYNKNITDLYQLIKNHPSLDEEKIKKEVMKEVRLILESEKLRATKEHRERLEQLEKKHKEQIKDFSTKHAKLQSSTAHVPVQQQAHIQPQTPIHQPYTPQLSTPEKKLLNFLFNQSEPMSYAKIAAKTGHSINTVRVNMNLLKKKSLVEENMLPSGVKLFTITNKERIKKVYNLQVL